MTSRNDWVAHLIKYPLKELRSRQVLNEKQIKLAYKTKNTEALKDLRNMEDSLTESILLKTY